MEPSGKKVWPLSQPGAELKPSEQAALRQPSRDNTVILNNEQLLTFLLPTHFFQVNTASKCTHLSYMSETAPDVWKIDWPAVPQEVSE